MEIPGTLDDSFQSVGSKMDDDQLLKSGEPDIIDKPLQTGDKISAVHQSD